MPKQVEAWEQIVFTKCNFSIRWAMLLVCGVVLSAGSLCGQIAPQPEKPELLLPNMPLHDPWILASQADHTYYLYTSNIPFLSKTAGVGTMVYRSTDLRHWQPPVAVFTLPGGLWARQGGWAPEVHVYHGRSYLFTTVHNEASILAQPPAVWRTNYSRGTVIAASDSPMGPFKLLDTTGPVAPANFMTLDGTLYVAPDGKPWMVYAHEWLQKIDGTIEAVPLKGDLTGAAGNPVYLFKGSDAPWINAQAKASQDENRYVTDGPELFRTRDGHLLMLWSSYDARGYVQTIARSRSGKIEGPWEQLDPLVKNDSGHGMLFRRFDGQLMLILHRPFKNARGKLYEVEDQGDHLKIIRERSDLDGDASAVQLGTK